jgi:hypothetical protein
LTVFERADELVWVDRLASWNLELLNEFF